MLRVLATSAMMISLAACGLGERAADQVPSSYVSPLEFQALSCLQMQQEAARTRAAIEQSKNQLSRGLWLGIAGSASQGLSSPIIDTPGAADLNASYSHYQEARLTLQKLKGRYSALQGAFVSKGCIAR